MDLLFLALSASSPISSVFHLCVCFVSVSSDPWGFSSICLQNFQGPTQVTLRPIADGTWDDREDCWAREGKVGPLLSPDKDLGIVTYSQPHRTSETTETELGRRPQNFICTARIPPPERRFKACSSTIFFPLQTPSCLIYLFIYLFIYFWLCWVFVAEQGLSLVAASGGYSSLQCTDLSLQWLVAEHGL